jgi:hypothetical protein
MLNMVREFGAWPKRNLKGASDRDSAAPPFGKSASVTFSMLYSPVMHLVRPADGPGELLLQICDRRKHWHEGRLPVPVLAKKLSTE